MGAHTFFTTARGESPQAAFIEAVRRAQYDHGHAGYTGTIAEKDSFSFLHVPPLVKPADYARELLDNDDPRVDDKWGPAGCVLLERDAAGIGTYLFFGWASS